MYLLGLISPPPRKILICAAERCTLCSSARALPASRRSLSSRTWRATRAAITRVSSRVTRGGCSWRMLVEATSRILPEVGPEMGQRAQEQLRSRGIDLRLGTRLASATGGHIVLDDGTELDANTLVWTVGVRANPVLARSDLPLDSHGRLTATAALTRAGTPGVVTPGDAAAVPDLTAPDAGAAATSPPNAQHALP